MPNWCSTNITINCKDSEDAKDFFDKVTEWTSKNFCDNGFGHDWLGNVLGNAGLATMKDGIFESKYRCRGSVVYLDVCNEQVIIDTETAWTPMLQMWKAICDKYLDWYELIYTAEECGMGLYFTNDPCVNGTYIVDLFDEDSEKVERFHQIIGGNDSTYYDISERSVVEMLQRYFRTEETDIDKLMHIFNESELSECINIHNFEWCDIEDLM